MKDYSELKSGSDVCGVACGIYENEIALTDEAVYDITAAFALFLENKLGKKASQLTVSVGHDSRTTAERIKTRVIESLASVGIKVLDCGLSSTPAMFMTTQKLNCDGAVEITASHHPADRNGLKFFLPSGAIKSDDIIEILNLANASKCCENAEGSVETVDFMSEYACCLREIICRELGVAEGDRPLEGLKIVVDASAGVGGFYAENVLKRLGADVSGSINLTPDGTFPCHVPDPENDLTIASVSDAVINSNADFGVVFNADADRVALIDPDGVVINGNRLIALACTIALENENASTVVTDSVTSSGLKTFIENLGGKQYRFKSGYKNVINEAVRLYGEGINIKLAVDTTGHAAFSENHFLDDGTYLATKVVTKLALLKRESKSFFDTTASLKIPLDTREFRIGIGVDEFTIYGELVVEGIERWCEAMAEADGYIIDKDNQEGIRVSVDDGWFMLKLSAHDPVLLLHVESDLEYGVKKILEKIAAFFFNCRFLNTETLIEYLESNEEQEIHE